jgi:hypothetical protein
MREFSIIVIIIIIAIFARAWNMITFGFSSKQVNIEIHDII